MKLRSLRRDDRGATAIEYGVIAALIGLGLVAALTSTKGSLNQDYTCIATGLGTQGASGCSATPPAPPPTTALGYAQIMVPSNRAVTGNATDTQGRGFYYYGNSADTTVVGNAINLTSYSGPAWDPSYPNFRGVVVAPNVIQITSWSGSVYNVAGNTFYGVVTPKGMTIVTTQAAPSP
jgi:pilus assembly protein Flp/PilA